MKPLPAAKEKTDNPANNCSYVKSSTETAHYHRIQWEREIAKRLEYITQA